MPQIFLLAICGAAHGISLSWPFVSFLGIETGQTLPWLNLLSLAGLFYFWTGSVSPIQAFFKAWTFSTTMLLSTWWWLTISLHTYGGLPVPLTALAVLLLAMGLGLIWALLVWLYSKYGNFFHLNSWLQATAFAACWLISEIIRVYIFTGFPWGTSAYAFINSPLVWFLPFIGIYGLTFLVALSAALLASSFPYFYWAKPNIKALVLPIRKFLVVGLILIMPFFLSQVQYTQSTGWLKVNLLQGNIAQDQKFQENAGIPFALAWYKEQLISNTADLVMAPETAIPVLPQRLPDDYLMGLKQHFETGAGKGQLALIGLPVGSHTTGYANSVMAFGESSDLAGRLQIRTDKAVPAYLNHLYRYDKSHLVPFGEFVPAVLLPLTKSLQIPMANFSGAQGLQGTIDIKGQRIAPNICYEDLFGEAMGAWFLDPVKAPTILANFSNIAWFGDTIAINQHLAISKARAIEFERPMIRSTNTGATVVINHLGQLTDQLPRLTRGALLANVEGRQGLTPYAYWTARWDLWPLFIFASLLLLAFGLSKRKK